jgi:hypothetical protein
MTQQPAEPSAVSGVVVADNEQRLRQQISQTREELGDTVAQLASKADVKRQVQVRTAALASRVQVKRDALASRVKASANQEAMRRTAAKGASTARERPAPLIAAGTMAGLVSLVLLLWRRKRKMKR